MKVSRPVYNEGPSHSLQSFEITLPTPLALRYKREAKMLCKKIVNFFSLLSHSQDMARQPQTGVGEELLSSVTGLAHYLKVLIRVTLTSALRLVCIWGSFYLLWLWFTKQGIQSRLAFSLNLGKPMERKDRNVRLFGTAHAPV
jgi:hypothetical protein